MSNQRKIRMGMIGGGMGAFIGEVHRMAANLDGQIELVCGAFSSSAERSLESGKQLFLPEDRCYADFETMCREEAKLPEGERMDFVSIVTPNHVHFPAAKCALEHGFHVVSDKPATLNLEEAQQLQKLVEESGQMYVLTHNYTGYPMVRQAKAMVNEGRLGEIRKVVVEYPQGWLFENIEADGQKQAAWRTDPAKSGAAGCMGDIGSHAENLAEFVTGIRIKELCADLSSFVPGRALDDDGNVLLRFENGAKGVLHASQIAVGEENNLKLYVYGTKAGLEWHQQQPNTLLLKWPDKPTEMMRAGVGEMADSAAAALRVPAGHPEGYLEAFANVYKETAALVRARLAGEDTAAGERLVPTIEDGVRGMAFIEAVVASSNAGATWRSL